MDKQLLSDLSTIKSAMKKRAEILEKQSSNARDFMDKHLIERYDARPRDLVKPVEPAKPKLETLPEINVDRETKYATEMGAGIYYSDRKAFLPPNFVIWICVGVVIVGALLLFIGNAMISGAQDRLNEINSGYIQYFSSADRAADMNYWQSRVDAGEVLKIVSFATMGGGVLLYFLIWLFLGLIGSSKKANYAKKKRAEMVEEKRDREIKNEQAKKKYEEDMRAYEDSMAKYRSDLDHYNAQVKESEEITKQYNDAVEPAFEKLRKYNEDINKEADAYIDEVLASLETYYPKKYLGALDRIAGYVEDARANTLQEAINLYEQETREEAFRNEQIYAAQEAARAAEEAANRTSAYIVRYRRWEGNRQYESSTVIQAKDAADAKAQVEGAYEAVPYR